MTQRSPGRLSCSRFASRSRALSLLAGGVLLACSPADPAPAGTSGDNANQNPDGTDNQTPDNALPDGVVMNPDGTLVDAEGNPVNTMVVDNGDGTTTTVVTDQDGNVIGPVNPTPANTNTPSPNDGPDNSVIVEDDDDQLLDDDPDDTPPVGDGELIDGVVCNSTEVSFEPVIPTVMLLIDRSTSMFCCTGQAAAGGTQLPNGSSPSPVGEYPDRWEAMRAAVDLLAPYSSEVQFGAMTYTGFTESNGSGQCPVLQNLDAEVTVGNFASVQALLGPSAQSIPEAKSETPTGEAIVAATEALAAVESEGPKYLVLLTDGLPEMCALIDSGPFCGADPAIAATQAAYAQGIQTFVIGIGFDLGDNGQEALAGEYLLNGIAHAGQGLPVAPSTNLDQFRPCLSNEARERGEAEPPEFYTGENWRLLAQGTYADTGTDFTGTVYLLPEDGDLGPQLAQVVQGVRSCSFEMEDNVDRARANLGAVRLSLTDGTAVNLMYQDPNGWDLDAERDDLVVVSGTACEQVQSSDEVENVRIEFPCEVRIPKAR